MQCSYRPTCPGCPLAEVPYDEQLTRKKARLLAALSVFPHLRLPQVADVVPATRTEGYRHRLKLPVDIQGREVHIGLYDQQTGDVLDTPDCPVLADPLNEALHALKAWLRGRREVHSVDLRLSDDTQKMQLVLACNRGKLLGGRDALADLRKAVPGLTSIAISHADPERKRVMGRRPKVIVGEPWITEKIGGTGYRLFPGAFFQADPDNARQLHDLVKGYVGKADTLMDLYAGVGSYGLMLAPQVSKVIAVEEVPQAAEAARAMAPKHVQVITSKVEELTFEDSVDVAILNPARRGADPKTLRQVAKLAKRLVYVSCGPETLARDLDILATNGMRVTAITPIDLFPQTPEVETVVHLEKKAPLRTWRGPGGKAAGPWTGKPSGVVDKVEELVVLAVGRVNPRLQLREADVSYIGTVATHTLIKLSNLRAPPLHAIKALGRLGHPIAGSPGPTQRFFQDKAGLLRPFIHNTKSKGTWAPLHGDLVLSLRKLGAPERIVQQLLDPSEGRQGSRGPRGRGPGGRGGKGFKGRGGPRRK